MIRLNVSTMQSDIRQIHSEAVNRSHHGRPDIIQRVPTGGRGRPSYWIDPGFLLWARNIGKTTAAIADYLDVSWSTVRTNLLQHGLAEPQPCPFPPHTTRFQYRRTLLLNWSTMTSSTQQPQRWNMSWRRRIIFILICRTVHSNQSAQIGHPECCPL